MPLIKASKRVVDVAAHPASPAVSSLVVLLLAVAYSATASGQDPTVIGDLASAAGGADTGTLIMLVALQTCSAVASAVLAWAKARATRTEDVEARLVAAEARHVSAVETMQARLESERAAAAEKLDTEREAARDLRVKLATAELRAEISRREG